MCTPLATIKVAADITELYELIDSQTDRLTRIVNDVLDMTRVQAGVLEPNCQAGPVVGFLNDAVARLRPSLPAFVEAQGGEVWVEEAPNGGARFVFTLPLAATNESKR